MHTYIYACGQCIIQCNACIEIVELYVHMYLHLCGIRSHSFTFLQMNFMHAFVCTAKHCACCQYTVQCSACCQCTIQCSACCPMHNTVQCMLPMHNTVQCMLPMHNTVQCMHWKCRAACAQVHVWPASLYSCKCENINKPARKCFLPERLSLSKLSLRFLIFRKGESDYSKQVRAKRTGGGKAGMAYTAPHQISL